MPIIRCYPILSLIGLLLLASPQGNARETDLNVKDPFAYGAGDSAPATTELTGYLDTLASPPCSTCNQTAKGPCKQCGKKPCGKKKGAKPNPCATSHNVLFYLNDFSYLNDPNYDGQCLGDGLKLLPVGPCGNWGTVDFGGQQRVRFHNEVGMGQDVSGPGTKRFQDTQHDFALSRTRLYTNWKVNDRFRLYVEGIFAYASNDNGTYKPRGIDRNFGDFQQWFLDAKLTDSTTIRVGRQELLYGAQRLISPLDWSNTRRRFEGAKLMWNHDDWAVDLFYTKFVPPQPGVLDRADYKRNFYGTWATYRGWENHTLEMFYLGYDFNNPGGQSDFSLHTVGGRLHGSVGNWMYDMQGGPQFGRQSGLGKDQSAFFGTGGIGRKLADVCWDPTLWFYYDYASGDDGGSDWNGFNELFPLGHKYLGFVDAVRRTNIQAPNVLLTMSPAQKWNLLFWYWHFAADKRASNVQSIGGTVDQSGATSLDFGDELDIIAKYGISPRSNILLGWSHLWRGDRLKQSGSTNDADFVYLQWLLNF